MKGDVLLLNEQAYLAKDDPYLLKCDALFTIDGPYSVNEEALPVNADHHSRVSIRLFRNYDHCASNEESFRTGVVHHPPFSMHPFHRL